MQVPSAQDVVDSNQAIRSVLERLRPSALTLLIEAADHHRPPIDAQSRGWKKNPEVRAAFNRIHGGHGPWNYAWGVARKAVWEWKPEWRAAVREYAGLPHIGGPKPWSIEIPPLAPPTAHQMQVSMNIRKERERKEEDGKTIEAAYSALIRGSEDGYYTQKVEMPKRRRRGRYAGFPAPRELREYIFDGCTSIDIEACNIAILLSILHGDPFADLRSLLQNYLDNYYEESKRLGWKQSFLSIFMGQGKSSGKHHGTEQMPDALAKVYDSIHDEWRKILPLVLELAEARLGLAECRAVRARAKHKKKNPDASMVAVMLQDHEREIMDVAIQCAKEQGALPRAYVYDELILDHAIDVVDLSGIVHDSLGLRIKFKQKAITSPFREERRVASDQNSPSRDLTAIRYDSSQDHEDLTQTPPTTTPDQRSRAIRAFGIRPTRHRTPR